MSTASIVRLVALAAIWGGAFLIIRIAAPVLGPVFLIQCRVTLGALFLSVVAIATGRRLNVREHWPRYLILGALNAAVPFLLYAYAAQTLSASVMSILNATAPVWATLIGAVALRRPLERRTVLGLALGVTGVGAVAGVDSDALQAGVQSAIGACLVAALSYGVAATYARSAASADAFPSVLGGMWAASLLLLPLTALSPPTQVPAPGIIAAVVVLGMLCTGFAFLLFFRLVRDIGAGAALTVTFLIPLFGISLGNFFLGERIGWNTVVGSALVIAGTALVARPGAGPQPGPRPRHPGQQAAKAFLREG
jgi:drug/metabolite transporter (DMT)-like permease